MANSSDIVLERPHPLDGKLFAANNVLLKPVAAKLRLSVRVGEKERSKVNKALGLDLPTEPKTSNTENSRTAMWLGPDEWLVFDEADSDLLDMQAKLADVTCSIVDVSHRNTAVLLSGNQSADVLNTGCPQNLSLEAFPVGACSRTILGKSEIVLLRTASNSFHVECWRSFSDYVWKHLVDGIKTL